MEKKKQNSAVKMVVLVAIGAALYGLGGIISVPIFAETSLKPAMAILALFAGCYGPFVGFLVGFLGHWITDLFMGWGVWPTWMLGSGIVGIVIGLFVNLSGNCIEKGEFGNKQIVLFIILSFIGNFVGYTISAVLDYLLFAEPLNKVFVQMILVATTDTLCIGILGTLLMKLVANRNKQNQNLELDEEK